MQASLQQTVERLQGTAGGKAAAARSPLDRIEPLGTAQSFRRDQEIYAEGDRAEYCYKVVTGAVRIVKLLEDGRRQVIEFLLPGDMLGFDLPDEHEFSAEAVSGTVLKCYRRSRVEAAAEQDAALARCLRDLSARNLRRAHGRIVLLGRKSARERLATFLVEMAERTRCAGQHELDLPMARSDIADHLGLTVETVCRALAQLRREHTIAVSGARIAVSDWHRLERQSGETSH